MTTNQMRREAAKRKLERQQQRRAQQAQRRRRVAAITSAVVVVVVLVGVVLVNTLTGGSDEADPAAAPPAPPAVEPETVTPASIPTEIVPLPTRPEPLPANVSCEYPAAAESPTPTTPPPGGEVTAQGTVPVTLQTSAGTVALTLDRGLAPCTVNSFVSLAEQGYFDSSPCHRLTTDPGLQVLQCGDPSGTGTGGPGYTVPDEVFPELTYGRGILAMANSGTPDSGGSQFFLVYGDGQLPPDYTVFGAIDPAGLQVIDEIAQTGHDGSLDPSPSGGAPIDAVTIETATVG